MTYLYDKGRGMAFPHGLTSPINKRGEDVLSVQRSLRYGRDDGEVGGEVREKKTTAYSLKLTAFFHHFITFITFITFTVIVSGLFTAVQAQSRQDTGAVAGRSLQIGDTIPDELWHLPLQVVNHPEGKDTITLNDYRDKKLIILDFWATWCGACISMFPKIEVLQNANIEDLYVLPVSYESLEKVKGFSDRRKATVTATRDLLSVCKSVDLQKYFPHKILPHYVWISSNGVLLGASGGDQLTQDHISAAINGDITFRQKEDVRVSYHPDLPMITAVNGLDDDYIDHYSVVGRYRRGLSGGTYVRAMPNGMQKITCLNLDITALVSCAFTRSDQYLGRNRVRFLAKDTSFYFPPADYEEYQEWRKVHTLCYEIAGHSNIESLRKIMQQDLDRIFPQFKIETKHITQPCWVMKGSTKHPKLKSVGGDRVSLIDRNGCSLKNASIFELFFNMNLLMFQNSEIPLEFALDDDEPVDLEFTCDLTDMDAINNALREYNIQFVLEERPVEMIVIQDRIQGGGKK